MRNEMECGNTGKPPIIDELSNPSKEALNLDYVVTCACSMKVYQANNPYAAFPTNKPMAGSTMQIVHIETTTHVVGTI